MKKGIFTSVMVSLSLAAGAVTPLWMRDVKISPDGKEIVFSYKGDLWKVDAAGGEAMRLTTLDSYEANPIWSPDGKMIAFSSDRHGNSDIFVMPSAGGQATRLTYNSATEIPETFSPDGKSVVFSAAIQDPVESAMFPTSRMTELYQVPVNGGVMTRILGTPAQMISYMPDGKSFLYQDIKGFEDEWRKHHTSSVTRDIWLYDAASGKHTNLTGRGGEDRNPVAAGDRFYFLSERDGGTMNVYQSSVSNPSEATAVSTFKTHPVRFLSMSDADGKLCYTYDGEIYTQIPGKKPVKVSVNVTDDSENEVRKLAVRSGAKEVAVSPDGKSMAFTYRGDVFVTSVEYSSTKQITSTPEAECDPQWSPDSKSLIYTSERDGIYNIYQAKMGREEDPNFSNATLIEETPLFKKDGHERMMAKMSPDGKQLAFVLDRNKLMVMDMDSKKVKALTDGSTYSHRDCGFTYEWSPDSKWIAIEIIDRKHDPYSDIAIIEVGTGQLTNLTNSGYFDMSPRWTLDGNAIAFGSERYGMRNHASWGSMADVLLVFMNQDAYDRYVLSEEDYAIRKEMDKKSDNKDSDSGKEESKDITVELDGITDRIVRITPTSSYLRDAIITADGETLYYITAIDDGNQLWKLGLRKPEFKLVSKLDAGLRAFDSDKDGKTLFIVGSSVRKFDPKGEKLTPVTYSATMKLDEEKEREYMFDNIAREEREMFYVKDMHGVDWDTMTKAYRKFLPHINNNYDFAELLSELLGELNVSHTGCSYRPVSDSNADRTASLGLLYDFTFTGDGLKVSEVVKKGPFDKSSSKVAPGVIVEKINGEKIGKDNDYTVLLNDISGKKTLVSLLDPSTSERWDEVIIPISAAKMGNLLYDRWVRQRADDVDRWSGGRLGYVHIRSMGDESFRSIYSDILGKYNDREGIVIDIRWNGGGRLHEDIEVLFSGKKYFTQEVRGTETCDMPSRRWNKPSVMVMCEACYSNAHGTPWVYKHCGIGKLVGMPVAGTMTSVNWVTMQDPTLVYGIPVVGYRLADGSFLENQQLEPDVKVANDPSAIVAGEDLQLKTAVEELLKDLDVK